MGEGRPGALLFDWTPDPLMLGVVAVLGLAYGRGLARAYARGRAPADARVMAFYGGLILVLLAGVSPLAALARQSAFAHQLQAAALRVVAPLLIFVAHPQRLIYLGLPKDLRRGAFARVWRDRRLNRVAGWLSMPVTAAALCLFTYTLWLLPPLQDAAVATALGAALERATQLAAGCLFFGVLFDARDPDLGGTRYGPRVVMLVFTALFLVVSGVAMTMKSFPIYPAYPKGPRFLGFDEVDDEATAGFVNWAWVSLVYLLTIVLVFFRWNAAELRAYLRASAFGGSNSAALRLPETAEELWMIVTPKNRRLGLTLAIIPAAMMTMAIALVVTLHYRG